jgi:hypothetical protein
VLLLGIDALKGVRNVVSTNLNASTGIFLWWTVWEDDVEPTLANLCVATELFDEGRVFLSGVVNDLDEFG